MFNRSMSQLISLALDEWTWKGHFSGRRLYGIAGPNNSDCPYECADDMVYDDGMTELFFDDGTSSDVIYADFVRGYHMALHRHRIHPIDSQVCLDRIISKAKHHDEKCKQVVRDSLLFAAHGEQTNE